MARSLPEPQTGSSPAKAAYRLEWLDGMRGLAAFFVVLHHVWLMTIGGYPGNNGPVATDWLVFGHLAVSVFIVVSGFSLMLSPSNHGMKLVDGPSGFLRRRFWRIVPPYWFALLLSSILIVAGLISTPTGEHFAFKDFFVYFFLMQDALSNVPPNGVFWSIAVEWHIYFLFPLLLWLMRKYRFAPVFLAVTVFVVGLQIAGYFIPVLAELNRFSPAYLILFLAGAGAAWLAGKPFGTRLALIGTLMLVLGFLAYASIAGTEKVVANYFWVDLWVGIATALGFVVLAKNGLKRLGTVLAWKPLSFVGTFAYSLYLCHAPILDLVRTHIVAPAGLSPMNSFWFLLFLGTPIAVAVSYLFFWTFERPFLTIRSFGDLRSALSLRRRTSGKRRGRRSNNAPYPEIQEARRVES